MVLGMIDPFKNARPVGRAVRQATRYSVQAPAALLRSTRLAPVVTGFVMVKEPESVQAVTAAMIAVAEDVQRLTRLKVN